MYSVQRIQNTVWSLLHSSESERPSQVCEELDMVATRAYGSQESTAWHHRGSRAAQTYSQVVRPKAYRSRTYPAGPPSPCHGVQGSSAGDCGCTELCHENRKGL